MIRFTTIVCLLILMGFGERSSAQERGEYLTPVSGITDTPGYAYGYLEAIRKVLVNPRINGSTVQFLGVPAFGIEYVLDIYFDIEDDRHYIDFRIGDKRIWQNSEWENIVVQSHRKVIDREHVKPIQDLFTEVTSQASYKLGRNTGLDGVRYYFSVLSPRRMSGLVWSPPEDSRIGQLVKLCHDIITVLKESDEPVFELTDSMRERIAHIHSLFDENMNSDDE